MTDEERKEPVMLSRDDLYSQIWSTPMGPLAVQYGITGMGLAKICARLNRALPAARLLGQKGCRQAGGPISAAGTRD